ncbi:hypothetical protein VTK26DRAFT_4202 [Humicola hyalothermophila]
MRNRKVNIRYRDDTSTQARDVPVDLGEAIEKLRKLKAERGMYNPGEREIPGEGKKRKKKPSRLRNVNRPAGHQAAVQDKQQHDRVQLEGGASEPDAARERVVYPAARQPPGHEGVERERRRDRRALKVLGLARGVLGYGRGGHVEAREARQAAEHEEGQAEVVDGRADADREGDGCGGDAE